MRTRSLCLLALLPLALAQAAEQKAAPPDPVADPRMIAAGFLGWHPDLRFRLHGLEAVKQGRHEDAFKFFQRAAFYADKPSQGMVAEMLWNGQGAAQDRALAYAWMDLAAERGYLGFLGLRERYWSVLGEDQRARALALGRDLYARYGDAAAKPRIATQLRRGRKQVTGSRTGIAGNVKIYVPEPGGFEQIDGARFHDPRYWDPDQYQHWHDAIWRKPRIGRVTVGEIEQAAGTPPASRVPNTAPDADAIEPDTPAPGTTPPADG